MYSQRFNYKIIDASIERPYVTTILGPRRVGKSFFIENYAKNHPHQIWVFLNMDDMDQRIRIQSKQLKQLIDEGAKQPIGTNNKIWVVVDEAQKCPELFDQIKILYDLYKGKNKIKFILTGSALLSLHKLSSESLAGRIELYYLHEFNLREAALLQEPLMPLNSVLDLISANQEIVSFDKLIKELAPFKPLLQKQLSDHLIWGGFPELLMMNDINEKIIYLKNYLQTYLEKDVRSIESITDINLYRNMMDILSEQTGSCRDDQRIMNALGCNRDTLKKYRGYLEATLLYQSIYPYIGSTLKRLVKSPKGYLLDNGLISILSGIFDLTLLKKTGLIGHRLENWFLNEINTWIGRIPERCTVNYWRTSSGIEVDFVVVKKPQIFPFEIAYNDHIDNKKISNLKKFMEDEPKAKWGYYIYQGNFLIDHQNNIIFIPCWAIA